MHVLLHSESLSENFIAVSRFKDEALLGQCFTYELSLHCQKQTLSFDGEGSFRTSWSHCRIYFYFGTLTDTAAVHTGDERKQSIRGAKNCCNKGTFFCISLVEFLLYWSQLQCSTSAWGKLRVTLLFIFEQIFLTFWPSTFVTITSVWVAIALEEDAL